MTGAVGQRRVPLDYLKSQILPLPPLKEQRRIVTKIDSLSGKSRRARDQLNHADGRLQSSLRPQLSCPA